MGEVTDKKKEKNAATTAEHSQAKEAAYKKVRIQDLIARANTEVCKKEEIYIPSLDGTITIRNIDESYILDALTEIDKSGDDIKVVYEQSDALIYRSCDMLHSEDLIKSVDVPEPFDLPKKLFTLSERSRLFARILVVNGFDDDDIGEYVKNE